MKAKKITIIMVTTVLALIWCSSAWADRFNRRDHRQTQRIHKGVRSGEITRPEVRRLKKEQLRIDRTYHRALADGHLSLRERQRLRNMQNRASRHIYQAKHNHLRQRLHRYYHKGFYRPFRHRHTVVNNHNVYYYPVTEICYADGYEFSVGVSDTGWQFAISARDNH